MLPIPPNTREKEAQMPGMSEALVPPLSPRRSSEEGFLLLDTSGGTVGQVRFYATKNEAMSALKGRELVREQATFFIVPVVFASLPG
jgi:hypothetical protein